MIKDGKIDAYHEQQYRAETAFLKQRTGIDVAKLKEENKKAKEIIRELLSCLYTCEYDRVSDLEKAEAFLKEYEE